MTKTPTTYHSNKLSKWLLIVAVMVGVFAFSGGIFNTSLQQQEATQIEELIKPQQTTAFASIVSYKKAFAQTPLTCYLSYFKKYPASFLSTYDVLCKVQFDSNLEQNYCFVPTYDFLLFQSIPQDSDEAFSSPSMG